jgi:DNA-binding NtrC family response regulator
MQYSWPGNIRELRHAIERAVIMSQEESLSISDFQFHQQPTDTPDNAASFGAFPGGSTDDDAMHAGSAADLNLERLEYRAITQALRRNRYVISNAAKDLGLTRAALYRRMEKHGI